MKKIITIYLLACILPFVAIAQWSNNPSHNTMIADTIGEQVIPHVVRNSAGETYISWFSDLGDLNFDVYLQKLNIDGTKAWDNEGLLISNNITNTWVTDYDMILDKDENVIIATQDERTGNSNVFAYKISPNGEFLWGNDGIQLSNTTGFDPFPKVVVTDNNDAVFMWAEEPEDTTQYSNINITRLDPDGSIIWESILYDTLDMMLPQIIKADNEGFFVSWITKSKSQDTMPGEENWMHVRVQRVGENGFPLWGFGIQVDSSNLMSYLSLYTTPYLTSDGNDGTYIMWQSFYPNELGGRPTTYVNRIYADGTIWKPDGYSVSTLFENYHAEAQMEYLGNIDKLVVCWNEYHYNAQNLIDCWGVRGQIFDTNGNYLWADTGKVFVPLNCAMDTSYSGIKIDESTNDNVILTYNKNYFSINGADTGFITQINAMSFDAAGDMIWSPTVTPISATSSDKYQTSLSNLADNQWVLAWNDNISNPEELSGYGIYAQNINVDGVIGPLSVPTLIIPNKINLVLSPNPTSNIVNINYTLTSNGSVQIDLLDVNGRIIKKYNDGKKNIGAHSKQIDIMGLNTGIYIVRLQVNNSHIYGKVIKN